MPSVSRSQQRFFGVELAKKRAGKKTKTKLPETKLAEFAGTKHEGWPTRVTSDEAQKKIANGRKGKQ